MTPEKETYLITLATGRQGTATATALLNNGFAVHALVRNRTTQQARELADLGCTLYECNPSSDTTVLAAAMSSCVGLFLNVFPSPTLGADLLTTRALLTAARTARTIRKIVLSTALNTTQHTAWLAADPEYPLAAYFGAKFAMEAEVRAAVADAAWKDISYTILRPAFLMHNYLAPLCVSHFPRYYRCRLDVAYGPSVRTAHFDARDLGHVAMCALTEGKEGARFDGEEVELANEELTIGEVASILGEAVLGPGRAYEVGYVGEEVARAWARRSPALPIRLWGEREGAFRVVRQEDGEPLGGHLSDRYQIIMHRLREFAGREKDGLKRAVTYAKKRRGMEYGEPDVEVVDNSWNEPYDPEDWRVPESEELDGEWY